MVANTKNKFSLSPQTYVLTKKNNESKIIINKIRFKVFFFFNFLTWLFKKIRVVNALLLLMF